MEPLVVATGAESSGTRLLARILATGPLTVLHRSLPHGDEWFAPAALDEALTIAREGDAPRWVMIERDPAERDASAVRNGHAPWIETARLEGVRARAILGDLPPGRTYRLTLEALRAEPVLEVARLSQWLGVHLHVPEHIRPLEVAA